MEQGAALVRLPDRRGRMEQPQKELAAELATQLSETLELQDGRIEIETRNGKVRSFWKHEKHDLPQAAEA